MNTVERVAMLREWAADWDRAAARLEELGDHDLASIGVDLARRARARARDLESARDVINSGLVV